MARPLPLTLTHQPSIASQPIFAAISLLILSALAVFMCASHSRKLRNWVACYTPDHDDHDPVIQLNINNQKQVNVNNQEQEVSIWQKNILMGGKCQIPDFSGVIVYDSAGNIVTPAKSAQAMWQAEYDVI
ncbi:hypothetical protein RJ641_031750 [Dillenia turbinata]|uniref:Uncharacterized protein n=1 Tax=Dillenia turbinata TaxID=194707 RepID=A0AAN8VYT3_9MAGN